MEGRAKPHLLVNSLERGLIPRSLPSFLCYAVADALPARGSGSSSSKTCSVFSIGAIKGSGVPKFYYCLPSFCSPGWSVDLV